MKRKSESKEESEKHEREEYDMPCKKKGKKGK